MNDKVKNGIRETMEANEILKNESLDIVIQFYESLEKRDFGFFKKYLSSVRSLDNYLENFKEFYNYRQNLLDTKQYNRTIPLYGVEYNRLKFNVSHDEAIQIINKRKADKATTKENFIKKHGVEAGLEKFEKFQKTSSLSVEAKRKISPNYIKESSPWCKEYYVKRNYSESEAIQLVKEYQRKNSGVSKWYWLGKGYTKEETSEILSAINQKKAFGKKQYALKYGDNWEVEWKKRIDSYRATINALPYECYPEKDAYYAKVYEATSSSVALNCDKIDNLHLRGLTHGYDLDHVFSVKMGFVLNVDPKIIGHWTNLKIVKDSYNRSKQDRCDKTYQQLMEDYHESFKENSN